MNTWLRLELGVLASALLFSVFESCDSMPSAEKKNLALNTTSSISEEKKQAKPLSKTFKEYWYAGDAELTSYQLEQSRYGEIRSGTSVLIFVTEPFSPKAQVKADRHQPDNIPILKLNATKKYLTGIYPYSVMSSIFYPVHDNQHALKTTFSMQEWCGHVYTQLNNRQTFEITSHSYFESEGDQNLSLEKTWLEDELWTKIRIDPDGLPMGELHVIPAMEYFRTAHRKLKAHTAVASITLNGNTKTYVLEYPKIGRELRITFSSKFPYTIEGWTETQKSGMGDNSSTLVSKGIKINRLKTPYWQKNSNNYLYLRDSLGL